MTLLLQKLLKFQENADNEQDLNLLKKNTMKNLTTNSNNQNQIINSKLNIERNNLRQFLHQSIFSKMRKRKSKLVALIQKSACREVSSCT